MNSLGGALPRMAAVMVAAIVTLAVAGCTTSPTPGGGSESSGAASFTGAVPAFSGPWAAEFGQSYRMTTSDLDHKILAKGSISDSDYANVSSVFATCMKNHGIKAVVNGSAGQVLIPNTAGNPTSWDAIKPAMDICQPPLNAVASLYGEINRNPQHLNENDIVVACLIRAKVAEPSYSSKAYAADLEKQKFPFNIDSASAKLCISNPLGTG